MSNERFVSHVTPIPELAIANILNMLKCSLMTSSSPRTPILNFKHTSQTQSQTSYILCPKFMIFPSYSCPLPPHCINLDSYTFTCLRIWSKTWHLLSRKQYLNIRTTSKTHLLINTVAKQQKRDFRNKYHCWLELQSLW